MAALQVLGVIPARWGSSRFPGKPLADLHGRPLIQHVHQRASRARLLGQLVVATDDSRIEKAVAAFGGEAVLTSGSHPSGSDRVAEVARRIDCDIVVNIQGDEPLVDPGAIDAAIQPLLDEPELEVATLAAPIDADEIDSPHVAKVVVGLDGRALYFSRSPIPYRRGSGGATPQNTLHHIGLFAYRKSFLLEFSGWEPSPLELTEQLEQLRVLEHGRCMRVVRIESPSPGVDTPKDLQRVARLLSAAS